MESFKLLWFFGPLFSFTIAWLFVRHPNLETRRKRATILLVLAPIVFPALLYVVYLISR